MALEKLQPLGRCQCGGDYVNGDHHYLGCPASTSPRRFPLEFRDGKWRMAWGELRTEILRQRALGNEIELTAAGQEGDNDGCDVCGRMLDEITGVCRWCNGLPTAGQETGGSDA